jgi:hypothetical protein
MCIMALILSGLALIPFMDTRHSSTFPLSTLNTHFSSKAIISQPVAESTTLSILDRGKSSFGQHLFKSVKFVHILHSPFFFLTMTMFANHVGYWTRMKPTSSNLCLGYCNFFI